MNLRLYAIRDRHTGRILPNLFFPNKVAAKAERDRLGVNDYCVTPGPDHRRFRG